MDQRIRLHPIAFLAALVIFLTTTEAAVAQQVEPPPEGGDGVEDPGDLSTETHPDNPVEEEPEEPVDYPVIVNGPGMKPIPLVNGRPQLMPRTRPKQPVPLLPDDSEWIWWWRLQRWTRLETPVAPEPGPAVTPGPGRPTAAPPPATTAPGNGMHPAADEALDVLLALWEEDPEEAELRAAILLSLARVAPQSTTQGTRGERVARALEEGLHTRDRRVHESAALALGVWRQAHGIPVLLGLLRDDAVGRAALGAGEVDERTRAYAAYGLGLVAHDLSYVDLRRPIAEALLEVLRTKQGASQELGAACVQALGQFPGEDAERIVPELLAVLRADRDREHVRGQIPLSLARLVDRHLQARGSGVLSRSVFDDLRRRALRGSEQAAVRQSSTLAVGRLGLHPPFAEKAANTLIEVRRESGDKRARHLAALGLADVGSGTHAAAQTRAIPELLAGLEDGIDIDRAWDAIALGWCAVRCADRGRPLPSIVGKSLHAAFPDHSKPRLRAALSLALGMVGHAEAEEDLIKSLQSLGEPILQGEAVAGLALLGGPSLKTVVPAELAKLDPLVEAYQAACAGIAHHDAAGLVAHFDDWLKQGERPSHQARFAASVALGWTGRPEAVGILAELVEDRQPNHIRIAAANSLGRVAERPGARWNSGYLDLVNPYSAPSTLIGTLQRPGVCDRY